MNHKFTDEEIEIMRNFLFRALSRVNPQFRKDIQSGRSTLKQECTWARLDTTPLPEREEQNANNR